MHPRNAGDLNTLKAFLEDGGKAAVPTYFIGCCSPKVSEAQLEDLLKAQHPESGVTYLGKQGVTKLKDLTIAYYDDLAVDALQDETAQTLELQLMCDRASTIEGEVDILLTGRWPESVVPETAEPKLTSISGSSDVKKLAMLLRPRYHFSAVEGQFYARAPYSNPDLGTGSHATRFIGLGDVGNESNSKYLHALGLKPATTMSRDVFLTKPANITAFPYDGGRNHQQRSSDLKRSLDDQTWSRWGDQEKNKRSKFDRSRVVIDSRKSVFVRNLPYKATEEDIIKFFAPCAGTIVDIRRGRDARGNMKGYAQIQFETLDQMEACCGLNESQLMGRPIYIDPAASKQKANKESHPIADCWFCLSNPNADLHLVASVAGESYCALDKGPITPFHVLVVPIDHVSSTLQLKDTTFAEMVKYAEALSLCFASQGLEIVIFERYLKLKGREGGNHCHYNIVGIPKSDTNLKDYFKGAASEIGFNFLDLVKEKHSGLGAPTFREQMQELVGDMEYILVVLPDGTSLVHPIMRGERIPYNFLRDVLASALGSPDRGDWKACKQSREKEDDMLARFKAKFSEYDIMK